MSVVSPRLQQVMAAQVALADRVLVLLSSVEPHSLAELVSMLGCSRAELMATMGTLSSTELVKHSRQLDEPGIRWYATAKGRALGDELYQKTVQALPELAPLESAAVTVAKPELDTVESPRKDLAGLRRVVVGERDQRGESRAFSWE